MLKDYCTNLFTGQTRSAPGSASATPERRNASSNFSTPIKSASKIQKAKLKKMKIKPAFKVLNNTNC